MREIHVEYGNGSEFLQDYLRDLDAGGLFVRTAEEYTIGEHVEVTIAFPQIPDGVALRGDVVWRRAPIRWRSAMLPGIGVGFIKEQRNRAEFLLDFCNGELSALRVKGRRIPADFRVDILAENKRIPGQARDISRGGLFVQTDARVAKDSRIDLELYLSQTDPPEIIPGRVAWERSQDPNPGVGIEFLFRTPIKRAQISNYVNDLERRLSIAPPPRRPR
jgi:type IV pilus assembly protein PilZ